VISPTQKTVPKNTQHSRKTDSHAPGEILTRNPSKQAVTDPCLSTRGHWDRRPISISLLIIKLRSHVWCVCQCTNIVYCTNRQVNECYTVCMAGLCVSRDSISGIATRYGLDGPGIESRWGRDFPHPFRPALGSTQLPVQQVPGLSRG
jgi:hypothetical protein